MKQSIITVASKKLVGINTRTNNIDEMDYSKAKIGMTFAKFYNEALAEQIKFRINPCKVFSVYTDYESDHKGDYTYFVGEEVESFQENDRFERILIPAQKYAKFTIGPGVIPEIVIDAWQKIWAMDEKALGGQRTFLADFEIYDSRSVDFSNSTVEIFIGIS